MVSFTFLPSLLQLCILLKDPRSVQMVRHSQPLYRAFSSSCAWVLWWSLAAFYLTMSEHIRGIIRFSPVLFYCWPSCGEETETKQALSRLSGQSTSYLASWSNTWSPVHVEILKLSRRAFDSTAPEALLKASSPTACGAVLSRWNPEIPLRVHFSNL